MCAYAHINCCTIAEAGACLRAANTRHDANSNVICSICTRSSAANTSSQTHTHTHIWAQALQRRRRHIVMLIDICRILLLHYYPVVLACVYVCANVRSGRQCARGARRAFGIYRRTHGCRFRFKCVSENAERSQHNAGLMTCLWGEGGCVVWERALVLG